VGAGSSKVCRTALRTAAQHRTQQHSFSRSSMLIVQALEEARREKAALLAQAAASAAATGRKDFAASLGMMQAREVPAYSCGAYVPGQSEHVVCQLAASKLRSAAAAA